MQLVLKFIVCQVVFVRNTVRYDDRSYEKLLKAECNFLIAASNYGFRIRIIISLIVYSVNIIHKYSIHIVKDTGKA